MQDRHAAFVNLIVDVNVHEMAANANRRLRVSDSSVHRVGFSRLAVLGLILSAFRVRRSTVG
jgi:hypothetical protein